MHTSDTPGRTDDEQLIRYLLGLLPDDEAERLDEASIADDEVASRLHAAENDLIDAYVSGTLTGDTLARFESFYLASPRRRASVAFARTFLRAVNRTAPADAENGGNSPPVAPDWQAAPVPALPTTRAPRWLASSNLMAAAAVVVLACGALLFQAVRLRNGLSEARRERIAQEPPGGPSQRLDGQPAPNPALDGALARARESAESLASRAAQAATTALVLLPQTRAAGPIPTLAVPSDSDRAELELRLESSDRGAARFRVALVDPTSNRTVWRSDPLVVTSSGRMPAVAVSVPVRVLKPQHYSLALTTDDAGDAKVVGSYAFQVASR